MQATKRGVDRTVAQARRTVEDTGLRARQLAQPGVVGELAQLRLSLRTSMRATQDVLRTGSPDDASLSEAVGLFERLSAHGHELDDELRRLEREPDRATIGARLPDLRERTEQITRSAEALRWAARDRARKFAEDDLAALSDQIDVEAGALRHWTREPARTPMGEPSEGDTVGTGAGGGARQGAVSEASEGRSWGPRRRSRRRSPPGTRVRSASYPWQKTRRPEEHDLRALGGPGDRWSGQYCSDGRPGYRMDVGEGPALSGSGLPG